MVRAEKKKKSWNPIFSVFHYMSKIIFQDKLLLWIWPKMVWFLASQILMIFVGLKETSFWRSFVKWYPQIFFLLWRYTKFHVKGWSENLSLKLLLVVLMRVSSPRKCYKRLTKASKTSKVCIYMINCIIGTCMPIFCDKWHFHI